MTPQPTAPQDTPLPWSRRLPSVGRFLFWNLLWWTIGIGALMGGLLYTEHVVKPVAEAGGTTFNPVRIFESEEAGRRVFGAQERMNILVLGLDYNHDEQGIIYTKGSRSDTMMVVSLSKQAEFLNVVSIPRDTVVYIGDGYGYEKINSAYSYGGAEQAVATASDFLGIPIHHYITVRAYSAIEIIDALGGLPIDVEKNMNYDDNWGNLHIHLKKGPQVLNGYDAVGYARFRMDEEGDRGRIRRQQQVIRALGGKLKEPALLSRLTQLARIVKENIDTDLKVLDMIDLANLYSSFDFSKMRSAQIVGDDAMDRYGVSYIEPYGPESERTVRRLLQSLDWLSKEDLRIRIVFRRAHPGIAYDLSDRFYRAGFRGCSVEEAAYDDPRFGPKTKLVWHSNIPRLKSVITSIIERGEPANYKQIEGRDDDLVILLGDEETGEWQPLSQQLIDASPPRRERESHRRSPSWEPEYQYTPEPPSYEPEEPDVTEMTYPRTDLPEADEVEPESDGWGDEALDASSVPSEGLDNDFALPPPPIQIDFSEPPPLPNPIEIDLSFPPSEAERQDEYEPEFQ